MEFAKDESSILSTSIGNFYTAKSPCNDSDFSKRDDGKPTQVYLEAFVKRWVITGAFLHVKIPNGGGNLQ